MVEQKTRDRQVLGLTPAMRRAFFFKFSFTPIYILTRGIPSYDVKWLTGPRGEEGLIGTEWVLNT